jgi:hypothetical protein
MTVTTMETAEFLARERAAIVEAAETALARAHVRHYESAGESEVHRRLEALFDRLLVALSERDLGPVVVYAQDVAEERFNAGYDLSEVQTAFNALEEAMWARALTALDPSRLAESLGLVSTILGSGKDALARRYVSLATNTHVPSLDLRALFAGAEGRYLPESVISAD